MLSQEILNIKRLVELPLVELNCEELHKSLSSKALSLSNRFLTKIVQNSAEHQKKY
jgi:hypothetical protein